MIRQLSLFPGLAHLLAVAALAAPAVAQGGTGLVVSAPPSQHIPVATSAPFIWQETTTALGVVKAQWPLAHGWGIVGDRYQFRVVPSWSTDPTVEVLLFPPYSGHPTRLERFLIQFPIGASVTQEKERALVVGFHPFSVSEKSVFIHTLLPELCAQKGWVLIAAYGLVDTNFGNMPSQIALDTIVELVQEIVHYNKDRVYAVGFSMGGGSAVNWALRHQDPRGTRVAGVICHTGTLDLVREFDKATPGLKQILADPDHFGGTPAQVPYEYERVSAFQMVGSTVDPDQAYVDNLRHIPIYLHWNTLDPNPDLIVRNVAFRDYLAANGFTYKEHTVGIPLTHLWSTLPMRQALDYLDRFTLPPDPSEVKMHATDSGNWLFAEVRRKDPAEHARFEVRDIDPTRNSFTVEETYDLGEIAFNLGSMGLDPTAFLRVTHQSGDGTGDRIVLKGYQNPPSSVLVSLAPPVSWSHDPAAQELMIDPTPTGSLGVIQVYP